MARRGWRGRPPADDAEARKRIIDATLKCVERRGPSATTVTDVADAAGITRRAVYRYFSSTEEMFTAAARVALDGWTERIEELTADMSDPTELLVEAVAHLIEKLPEEPLLLALFANDRTQLFSKGMVQPASIKRSRIVLEHNRIDWAALGYSGEDLDDLLEILIRIVQSMLIAPSDPPRNGAELRAFLRRWIAPLVTRPAAQGQRGRR
jgi:AcrR family transcriptional regulator